MNKLLGILLASTLATTAFAAPPTQADVTTANQKSFQTALTRANVSRVTLTAEVHEMTSSMTAPAQTAGHLDLLVTGGWNAEEVLFVANAKHEVFRVTRAPHAVAKIEEHLGCRGMRFAGGRGWFEHLRFALPSGFTYKGAMTVAYDVTTWIAIDAVAQPDGTPCPTPVMAVD